jgi:hypothetical protein
MLVASPAARTQKPNSCAAGILPARTQKRVGVVSGILPDRDRAAELTPSGTVGQDARHC